MRLFIAAYSLILICLGQETNAQSLSGEKQIAMEALLDSAGLYGLKDPERTLQFVSTILSEVPIKGNEILYIEALLQAANSEKMLSRKDEALAYASLAITLSNQVGDQKLRVRSYFMKGTIFGQVDDQDSTLIYYQKVIDLHLPEINPYYVSSAYTSVGQVYSSMANDQKAEEYLLKGYNLSSGDEYSKLFALSSLIIYYVTHDNPKYLPYVDTLSQSDFYKKASPTSFTAHFNAFLLLDEATDEEKEKTLREVYAYSTTHNSLVNQVAYGMRLYEHLHKIHKYGEAHEILLELQDKSIKSKNGVQLAGVTRALYENSKVKGNLTEALKYLEHHSEIRDSLLSDENLTRISELNIKFETAQKDHEIEQQKARIELVRRNRNFFILLACMLSALAIVVFIYFRSRARNAQRIAEQEKIIHLKDTERLEKEKELAELTATLESQERERNRIARDLHDGLGSMMSGISSQIEYLRAQPAIEEAGLPHLTQLRELVNEATSELRRTSYELMPAKLLRLGLEPAIRDLCLNLLVKNGIDPTLEINADLSILNPEQQLTLYRIIQELLNNTVKHAAANQVFIQFNSFDDEISMVVEDNGKGFDVASRKMDGGLGLGSLSSRVSLLKGFLDIASMPGEGTTVTVNFNLHPVTI